MELINCPICSSPEYENHIQVKDRLKLNSDKQFQIIKCECGFIYLNPRPTSEEIYYYYKNDNYDPHRNKKISLYDLLYKTVQKIAFKIKLNRIKQFKKTGKLLDIGGGQGEFASYMHSNGYDVSMHDSYSKYVGKIKFHSNIDDINDRFDIISMWHVLEHIHDLSSIFKNINMFLNKNGILIIVVPNHNGIERKYYQENWAPYDAPRHLYHFDHEKLEELLQIYGFRIVQNYSMLQDSFYNILLSINKINYKTLVKACFISIITFFSIIFYGYKKSSSIMVICEKI